MLLAAGLCRFALTSIYQLRVGSGAIPGNFSGRIGVPLVAFAFYGSLALLLEEGAQRTVLPLGRRGRARMALEGDLSHQVERAESEPGVRRQP